MKIGIIGIGEMGGTLARRWCEKGHTVRVANSRGLLAVKHFADSIGAGAADVRGAVEGAEVVVLALAFPVAATLPKDLYDSAAGDVVIIDTSNYYPDVRDARIPEIDEGMPESIWTSRQLGRPVFKAFNSIMFYALSQFGKPEGSGNRLAIDSSLQRPRTAATTTPRQHCGDSMRRSEARPKRSATPNGEKSMAGFSRTNQPTPMSTPRSSK
jgi:predicted dinucleotide-binding enzyme